MKAINGVAAIESLGFSAQELASAGATQYQLPDNTVHIAEIAANNEEIYTSARDSLDFLAALAMPAVFKYLFPAIFISVWTWLTQYIHKTRDFSQLALGLPRGFGKTMVIKLFILYTILFTSRKFILVLCETTSKAKNILADVVDMLDTPNIRAVFGDWRVGIEQDTQELKKFGYRGRNIILMGAGVESGIRGITLKNERPDLMIFDDIQSRICAESQIQSENLEREMIGTAMKAKSPHGCLFIFIANMYPTKWSLLRRLKSNPNWIKFIVGGILADGTSLWEELQPIEQLKKEFQNDILSGHPEIFYAEVLNDENASANSLINLATLPVLPYSPGDIHCGNFIIIDPSGKKLGSDDTAIGYCEIYDGYPVLREVISDKLSPGETIRAALSLCFKFGCSLVAIESVAYQASLCYWFEFICTQMNIVGIQAVEVYPGGTSKNSRILTMFKSYSAGELFIAPEARAAAHSEIAQFNPLKTTNVDNILDLLHYMPKVIAQHGAYIVANATIQMQEFAATEVPDFNSPF